MSTSPIQQLREIMQRLRDPDSGCPWDRKQDHHSLVPYLIEEAYEVVEAIESGDVRHLREELGDLLLQVLFHSQLAEEAGQFDFDAVCEGLSAKMIRRHPHVFAGKTFASEAERKHAWEEAKREEREARATGAAKPQVDNPASLLQDISHAQPALLAADQIQSRAARYGFDWQEVEPVYEKLQEEVDEVREAVAKGDRRHIIEEVGDLLFVGVNLARHLGVDAETALRGANRKFSRRFAHMEQSLASEGRNVSDCELAELDQLWEQAKRFYKQNGTDC